MNIIVSAGTLEKLSMKELVILYNSACPDRPVEGFSCFAEAVKRVLEALAKKSGILDGGGDRRPSSKIDFPSKGWVKVPRDGTMTYTVYLMLKRGTTRTEICSAMGWEHRRVRDRLRLMHRNNGIGIQEDGNGILRLVT